MAVGYLVTLSAQERRVIKNLLQDKVREFQSEIEANRTDHMYVSERKDWIKNYRALIRKLDTAEKREIKNEN